MIEYSPNHVKPYIRDSGVYAPKLVLPFIRKLYDQTFGSNVESKILSLLADGFMNAFEIEIKMTNIFLEFVSAK